MFAQARRDYASSMPHVRNIDMMIRIQTKAEIPIVPEQCSMRRLRSHERPRRIAKGSDGAKKLYSENRNLDRCIEGQATRDKSRNQEDGAARKL
ncbi:hypothetical protein C8R41DRAFT_484361 [Lentinula lateritia]|uniref:Uncharacterized protein n=1 Tax=Lentinula lateritia TaxID=40482 RepID=A0ABQ8VXS1_9AGAR|nr:hypothetical protein C8R41DRAFT_484361 [Lentinula lateritia]